MSGPMSSAVKLKIPISEKKEGALPSSHSLSPPSPPCPPHTTPSSFNRPAPTLDLAPGFSPLAHVPLLPPAWMDLSSGKVWPHVARLSRIQVISSDRRNRLLPEPAALRGRVRWRN
ncbi:hypothetical protein NQZ68_017405 [Dissostichus eleginoides]|nr:hypothetical protein NQZ68_017405 [Dissostichus eleginoides]